jgi:DNA-binding transcriptional LysR family regulator
VRRGAGMTVDLRQILAFLAVADLGSFRRAAERLNTTQPNISARIAKLEARLGTVLMERDAGSVRLTARGKALLDPARAVAGAVDALLEAAGDSGRFNGALRLGVTELIAHTWLRALLVALRDELPQVTVELTVDMSERLGELLDAGELDLALQNGPFARATSGTLPLGTVPYVWVAAPGVVAGVPDAAALAQVPILTHPRGTRPWRELAAHFRARRVTPRLVPSSNLGTCLQMTLDRLGVACLPRPLVAAALADGRLVEVPYPWRQDDLDFSARHDADRAPPWTARAAALAQQIAQEAAG